MDYKIISCDDHLDLAYLPNDLWTSRMSGAMRARAPHVQERNGKTVWVCDDKVWGTWRGHLNPDHVQQRIPLEPLPAVTAFDRGDVVDFGELRPAIPKLRLADMDRDHVYSQVIYGPVFSIRTDDPFLRDQCYQVYNDALAEFCAASPERLMGVPMLPPTPEAATRELYRLAKMGGWRQANMQVAEAEPRLHDPAWEPFWKAFEETGIILSFHVTVFGTKPTDPAFGKPAAAFTTAKLFIEQFLDPFVDLFAWGILERHPKLRIVMAESGMGWLPWLVQELDHRFDLMCQAKAYWDQNGGIPLTMKPSDLFKRQIFASFQEDKVAIALIPFFGENNVLWASDYPHPDSTWPFSLRKIDEQMSHLSPQMRKKLLHDNAAKLYGLTI